MKSVKGWILVVTLLFIGIGSALGASVSMKISGPGAVNDTTIKAGEKVFFDIYVVNDTIFTGFSLGFAIKSPTIKTIIHVPDSGNGLNRNGDVKGYNGWEDKSIWDFAGVMVAEQSDWDGVLPELLGIGGICIKKDYMPHELMKVLSFEAIIPEPGVITVDSSFFPPGGTWMFAGSPGPVVTPEWGGPYTFKVVK
jgi:hypothetical protein